jgi:hypothetical protein
VGLPLCLLLGVAGDHACPKHAPQHVLTGATDVGASLASAVAEPRYAQQFDELIIVQIQLRLAPLENGVYDVAEPLGAFLFVHRGVALLPWFQDSIVGLWSSVNVRGHRV